MTIPDPLCSYYFYRYFLILLQLSTYPIPPAGLWTNWETGLGCGPVPLTPQLSNVLKHISYYNEGSVNSPKALLSECSQYSRLNNKGNTYCWSYLLENFEDSFEKKFEGLVAGLIDDVSWDDVGNP